MEKGQKEGKGKLGREMMRWLGSGSERSRAFILHPLGMESSEHPRGASQEHVRRYVHKDPCSAGELLPKEDRFTILSFGSLNRFRKTQDCKKPVEAILKGQ